MQENWKDIKDYEGLYQVSDFGNVRSLDRIVRSHHEGVAIKKGRVLRPGISKVGYPRVLLIKDGIRKNISIHRLVALAFVDNAPGGDQVNHIDGVKKNNVPSNLEWCDIGHNNRHARRMGLNVARSGKESHSYGLKNKQSIVLINTETNELKPICEVAKEYGYTTRHITMMVKGERTNKTVYKIAS